MGLKYIDITVDTTALYAPERRGYGTAGMVGYANGVALLDEPTLFRNYGDVKDTFGESSGIAKSLFQFFENKGKEVYVFLHEATTETQRTFSGTGSKRDFVLPYFALPSLTVQADLGSGIQAVTEGVHFEVDYGNKTIWFDSDYIPINGTDNVLVDGYSVTADQVDTALDELSKESIQIIGISYCFDPDVLVKLKNHLVSADSNGRDRYGFATLPKGEADETNVTTFLSGLKCDFMSVVAHNSWLDPAAAMMGVCSYYPPQMPLTNKVVAGLGQTQWFSDDEIFTLAGDAGYTSTGLNVIVIDRVEQSTQGASSYVDYTISEDSTLRYVNRIRVIQTIKFALKAGLVGPQFIGNPDVNITKEGLKTLHNGIDGIMYQFTVKPDKMIYGFKVHIPLEEIVNNEPNITAGERGLLTNAITSQHAEFEVEIDHRGALNTIKGKARIVPGSATATA